MEEFIKKYTKKLFAYLRKHIWFIAGFIIGFAIVFGVLSHVYFEYWKPLHVFHDFTYKEQKASELHLLFTRNFGWSIWVGISLFALVVTFILTIWGRKIQNKQWETQKDQWETQNKIYDLQHASHLHERYEKAANMLGSEVMAVRVAGCRALSSLGKDDERMKEQCVRLLFSFINNPYLEDDEKELCKTEKLIANKFFYKNEFFETIFPIDQDLRDDIQEAADSFSAIYEKYKDVGIDRELVKLPHYFVRNRDKKYISLIKANLHKIDFGKANLSGSQLQGANLSYANLQKAYMSGSNFQETTMFGAHLQEANLSYAKLQKARLGSSGMQGANLQEANLWQAELQGVNLSDAKLNGADVSFADMRNVEGLTKEQILSAKWGYDILDGSPPSLPEELANDPEVQEWLTTPHYDYREKKDS